MKFVHKIILAGKTVFSHKAYRLVFFVLVPVIFFLFILIPVRTIPSNTLELQLTLYKPKDYAMLTLLSTLASFFVLLHVYSFRQSRKAKTRLGALGGGGVGGSAGTLASVFGAATCPMCVASLFGFLGAGTVGFALRYQWWIFAVALLAMLLSLYSVSRRVTGICENCK